LILLTAPLHIAVAQGNPDAPGLTQAPGLFVSQVVPGAAKMNAAAFRHRSVTVNIDLLKNKNILLNLFDDTEFDAERTHVKEGPEGEFTWSGQLLGPVPGSVLITVFGDSVAGRISSDGQLFEINPAPGGRATIEEIDLDQLPPHADPQVPDEPAEGELLGGELLNGTNMEPAPATAADTGDTIDLMVVYTQAARARYGASGIQAKIINAVDALNNANANSAINARFRLVHMAEVDYTETGDMSTALSRLKNKTDGYMDNVHALRDQYGADIVSLINEDNNKCGTAYVMTSGYWLSNNMEQLAFNVTFSSCMSSETMSHEIGHNEGCAHDRANAGSGSYDYSYGHRDTTTGFRTIMSYACSGGACPRVNHFSNPNVDYNGAPTGIDHNVDPVNSADNARSLNNNETIVANWRQAVVSDTVPAAPSGLGAVSVSDSQIDISWVDNAGNEDGFYIERSPNGTGSWTVIATLAANSTSHSDNGLVLDTTYFYRVRAYNGVGNSAYSNMDSATTSIGDGDTVFAAIGDYADGSIAEGNVASLINGWGADFVITVGDNRYGANSFDTVVGQFYCNFLTDVVAGGNCNGGNSPSNDFYPAPGNHDYTDGSGINEYLNYFTLPGTGSNTSGTSGNERYYDFVRGPVHFFVLDSEGARNNSADMTAQKNWLQAQLAASTAQWRVVYLHHAPYSSSSNHGSDPSMQWPYAAWGADAVIAGHDHIYERLSIDGIPYFVNGLGGRSLYGLGTPVSGSEFRYNSDYGAMRITANSGQMKFEFVNTSGAVVDSHTVQSTGNGVVSARISNGNDDVEEELSSGTVYLDSTDMELGDDPAFNGSQTVGLRFNNLEVPRGATIVSAYLEFVVDETGSTATNVNIHAHDTDNAPAFAATTQNVTSRTLTAASTAWNIPAWNTVGEIQQSPDISAVVQEVVDRAGWSSNNSMAFIISGTGTRTAEAYEGVAASAPLLHIEYTGSVPGAVGIHEAEDATLSGSAISTNHLGYSGTGFVDYVNPSGDYVEWTVDAATAGQYALRFRYALLSGDRPLEISVNSQVVDPGLSFPATGSFSNWGMTADVNANLNSGINTIRATAIGSSGANVDYLEIATISTPNVAPAASFTHIYSDLMVNFTDTSTDSDGSVVSWSWDFGDSNTSTVQHPSHTYGSAGIYTVSLTVTDDGGLTNSTSQSVTVTAPDTTPPSIIAPADKTVEATGATTPVALGTPTVSDDTDPSPSVSADNTGPFPVGITTVTWTATDAAGNSASATQNVTVEDTTAPTVTAPADVTVESSEPVAVALGTPAVSDLADPNPTVTNDAPALFPLGTTTVTWTATDASGNSSTATQTVIVNEPVPQPLAAPTDLIATVEKSGKGKSSVITGVTLSWTDNSNETGFVVEGCQQFVTGKGSNRTVTCDYVNVGNVEANVTSFDVDLIKEHDHFRVKAVVNLEDESGWSNEASF